ncbi:MAG: NAD(P)H-dependent oxidoreductase subunit E [Lactobacillus sp.]|jgi:NADH-quinone oxidoreductase subunit E|nr:NAD(P)H-dependent oxidoreductase subunit E [Lactobacillus sp.]
MRQTMTLTQKVALIKSYAPEPQQVVNILLALQAVSEADYVDLATARLVADYLKMNDAQIFELISYYPILHSKPQAHYVLEVCDSAPCQLTGNQTVLDTLKDALGVGENEASSDGEFMYRTVTCLGACDQAPFIRVNGRIFPNLTTDAIWELLADLKAGRYAAQLGGA